VKRCKNHFHNLLCGASVILGNNGFIWISSKESTDHQVAQKRFQAGVSTTSHENVSESKEQRNVIARLRNCILALARERIMIFDTSIQYTYEASLKFEVGPCCQSFKPSSC
jgi:exosome complex component RRP4